jgi:glycerol-3-phosphate O-acyltransferase
MLDDVYETVLEYPRLKDYMLSNDVSKKEIYKNLKEIHGNYKFKVVGGATKFIDKTLMKLYHGINLELPDEMNLHQLSKDNHLVLVPNHQSHADYIALTYILYKKFRLPVYVAAGVNLNILLVGDLFKRAGAFFLRRSFHDDKVYKMSFEGYLYYLLKNDHVVEFFFEGGRTRTGKLLKPRYGLFRMLLDVHSQLPEGRKKLMFLPVAIAHEHIPEEKAHARELRGQKKVKEKPTQLLKLFKLASKKLGTINVRFGEKIALECAQTDLKTTTQQLAFDCFKSVGRQMPVTPTSLMALVLLDSPAGALTWNQILQRCKEILEYCRYFDIPTTQSLSEEIFEDSIKLAMDMFINNNKIEVIKRERLNQLYYSIKKDSRVDLLYHKNMILHHFLVPGFINSTWFNIFNGTIKDATGLTRFLMIKRKELKYEFYLPSTKAMIEEALKIVEYATSHKINDLGEALKFSSQDLFKIAKSVRPFSTAFNYIYEAYYLASITTKYFGSEKFTLEKFLTVSNELFQMELEHGRVIKYPESYSVPMMKETLLYLEGSGIIQSHEDHYHVIDEVKASTLMEKFARDINDQVSINLKFSSEDP